MVSKNRPSSSGPREFPRRERQQAHPHAGGLVFDAPRIAFAAAMPVATVAPWWRRWPVTWERTAVIRRGSAGQPGHVGGVHRWGCDYLPDAQMTFDRFQFIRWCPKRSVRWPSG
jgi:hypothetical protein